MLPGRLHRAVCALRMGPAVNIRPRRGVWGTRVSPRPRPAGEWGNRVSPFPHPRAGRGGRSPPKNNLIFIAALCGIAAWTAEVTIVRMVQPPSQPPPAGGRSRTPSPQRGEGWGGGQSPCPRRRDEGGPPALPGDVHRALCAMRMTVSREHRPQGCGETRFPHPPPGGRVWEGCALPGSMFIPSVCGTSRIGGRGNPRARERGRDALVASTGASCPRSRETCERPRYTVL